MSFRNFHSRHSHYPMDKKIVLIFWVCYVIKKLKSVNTYHSVRLKVTYKYFYAVKQTVVPVLVYSSKNWNKLSWAKLKPCHVKTSESTTTERNLTFRSRTVSDIYRKFTQSLFCKPSDFFLPFKLFSHNPSRFNKYSTFSDMKFQLQLVLANYYWRFTSTYVSSYT